MNRLIVRDGKGGRDRATILPEKLIRPLRVSLEKGCRQHEADLAEDAGWVELSHALAVNTAMQDANGLGSGFSLPLAGTGINPPVRSGDTISTNRRSNGQPGGR